MAFWRVLENGIPISRHRSKEAAERMMESRRRVLKHGHASALAGLVKLTIEKEQKHGKQR